MNILLSILSGWFFQFKYIEHTEHSPAHWAWRCGGHPLFRVSLVLSGGKPLAHT